MKPSAAMPYSLQSSRGPTATEYEIVTSKLHSYIGRGFETKVPLSEWYKQYQMGSPLTCNDWEAFYDPRETTYTLYVATQKQQELRVNQLLQWIETQQIDANMDPAWSAIWQQFFAPLRYPLHGLSMVAAYIGQMAPSGRLTMAALFQASDEIKRIERLAYRLQLRRQHVPHFATDSQTLWQRSHAWQPLRRTIEELLVTYDWGEAFVALNLCVKPLLDQLVHHFAAELARSGHRDAAFADILDILREDTLWQQNWTRSFVQILQTHGANPHVIQQWTTKWNAKILPALETLAQLLNADASAISTSLQHWHNQFLTNIFHAPEES